MVDRLFSFLAGSFGSAIDETSASFKRSLGRESHVHPIRTVE
jgi:hypothetical protein